jgi:hypothetical protein
MLLFLTQISRQKEKLTRIHSYGKNHPSKNRPLLLLCNKAPLARVLSSHKSSLSLSLSLSRGIALRPDTIYPPSVALTNMSGHPNTHGWGRDPMLEHLRAEDREGIFPLRKTTTTTFFPWVGSEERERNNNFSAARVHVLETHSPQHDVSGRMLPCANTKKEGEEK